MVSDKKGRQNAMLSPVKGAGALLYILLRSLYLLVTVAVLPMAWVYFTRYLDESGEKFNGMIAFILVAAVFIWSLLYIGLEAFGYPLTLQGAVIFSAVLLQNFFSGMKLTEWDISFSGYCMGLASLSAQFLFHLFLFLAGFLRFLRPSGYPELPAWYFLFFIFALLTLGVSLFWLGKPFVQEIKGSDFSVWGFTLAAGMISNIYYSIQILISASVIRNSVWLQPELRWKLWEAWVLPVTLAILLTVLLGIFIPVFSA